MSPTILPSGDETPTDRPALAAQIAPNVQETHAAANVHSVGDVQQFFTLCDSVVGTALAIPGGLQHILSLVEGHLSKVPANQGAMDTLGNVQADSQQLPSPHAPLPSAPVAQQVTSPVLPGQAISSGHVPIAAPSEVLASMGPPPSSALPRPLAPPRLLCLVGKKTGREECRRLPAPNQMGGHPSKDEILAACRAYPADFPLLQSIDYRAQGRQLPNDVAPICVQLATPMGDASINFYYSGTIQVGGKDTALGVEFIREWSVKNPKAAKIAKKQRTVA